jgi:hypothetical protein
MKQEIIYTEHYALIVSDEKIVEGSFIYETNIGEVSMVDKWYCEILEKGVKVEPFVKVIAHRPLEDAPILEGVPLLPKFEDDDFLNTQIQVVGDNKTMSVSNFFKKCGKETYKYTEEDLRKAYFKGASDVHDKCTVRTWRGVEVNVDLEKLKECNKQFTQPLQQTKRPKYFECETTHDCCGRYMNCKGCDATADMLNIRMKTTNNSQGQIELKGEYSYE